MSVTCTGTTMVFGLQQLLYNHLFKDHSEAGLAWLLVVWWGVKGSTGLGSVQLSSGVWWKQVSLDLFGWWALGVKCSFHVLLQLVVSAESK